MPDAKPMSEERFVMADEFIGPTADWGDSGSTGRFAAELRDEVRRLKKREEKLATSLRWAMKYMRILNTPRGGRPYCRFCGNPQDVKHDSGCSYRQAGEVLGQWAR